jgi:hypothetical protein
MPSCSGLLVVPVKPNAKYTVHTVVILLFYLVEEIYRNKTCTFSEDITIYYSKALANGRNLFTTKCVYHTYKVFPL